MKKNLRKIPLSVRARLTGINGKVVVGCTKNFSRAEILSGALGQFGMNCSADGQVLNKECEITPSKNSGRYSKRNVCGREVVRKDLPKVPRLIEGEAPDYNGFGTHPTSYYRDCYPRYYEEPRNQTLRIKVVKEIGDVVVVSFMLSEVLDKNSPLFEKLLLESLNILQENIGRCGVENAETPMTEFQHVLNVDWQFFPPGKYTGEELACIMLAGRHCVNREKVERAVQERYDFFKSLGANIIILGQNSLDGYIGAQLKEGLVVFDNVKYGNAVYIIKGDWKTLSKLPRIDLRRDHGDCVQFVPHGNGWQDCVRRKILRLS